MLTASIILIGIVLFLLLTELLKTQLKVKKLIEVTSIQNKNMNIMIDNVDNLKKLVAVLDEQADANSEYIGLVADALNKALKPPSVAK
jgi:hypothetical protein